MQRATQKESRKFKRTEPATAQNMTQLTERFMVIALYAAYHFLANTSARATQPPEAGERKGLRDAVRILLDARHCWHNDGLEIAEEISAQFDIPMQYGSSVAVKSNASVVTTEEEKAL